MEYNESKEKFIEAWGALGSNWGINKTMAQIHALLLIAHEPLSTEEIMEALLISRGNVNMNVRALIDWGLASKTFKSGERRDYFKAEKDIWKAATRIFAERRKREIEPLIRVLGEIKEIDSPTTEKEKELEKTLKEIEVFASKMDGLAEKIMKADESWIGKTLLKLVK